MKNLFSHAALLVLSIFFQGPVASASSSLPEHPATHPNVVSVDALNGARQSPSTPRQPLPPELARAATHPDELGEDWLQIAPGVWERNAAAGLVDRTIFGTDGHRWLAGQLELELDKLYAIAEDANAESNLWERIDLKETELAHAWQEAEREGAASAVKCYPGGYAGPYGGTTPGAKAQSWVICDGGNANLQLYDQVCADGKCNTYAPAPIIGSGWEGPLVSIFGVSNCSDYAAVAINGVTYQSSWSGACGGTPPSITASPATVQIPAGQSTGSTTLSWDAPGYGSVSVFVSFDGAAQVLFVTTMTSGSLVAPWIQAGHQYVFRLYATEDLTKVLASVTVTGQQLTATLTANPTTVLVPTEQSVGSTTLSWNAPGYSSVSIYVSFDGGTPVLLTTDKSTSSIVAPWIQAGHQYVFRLFPTGNTTTVLASVTVTGTVGCGEVRFDGGWSTYRGYSWYSCDKRFLLSFQADGNLVLYMGSKALWATYTNSKGGYRTDMQTDGNLVVYNSANKALWWSNTAGNTGAYLVLQNDGNLVIYSSSRRALWSSNTAGY